MPTRFVPLSSLDRWSGLFGPSLARMDRQIPVDAFQRGEELVLHFDLPGVREDSVEISLERRVLTVKAERSYTPQEGDTVFIAERPWGQMSREIVLGDSLDFNRVNASFDSGVLTVTVPMAANAKTRRIDISHAPLEAHAEEVTAASTEKVDA